RHQGLAVVGVFQGRLMRWIAFLRVCIRALGWPSLSAVHRSPWTDHRWRWRLVLERGFSVTTKSG
ncbi:hypothetical protein, partial [Xanthomonas fragariae]|uniref:hypothetical protein n=2 Tax=Xanthomonas fragariae TaxID=48664 RepID=UPI001F4871C0